MQRVKRSRVPEARAGQGRALGWQRVPCQASVQSSSPFHQETPTLGTTAGQKTHSDFSSPPPQLCCLTFLSENAVRRGECEQGARLTHRSLRLPARQSLNRYLSRASGFRVLARDVCGSRAPGRPGRFGRRLLTQFLLVSVGLRKGAIPNETPWVSVERFNGFGCCCSI